MCNTGCYHSAIIVQNSTNPNIRVAPNSFRHFPTLPYHPTFLNTSPIFQRSSQPSPSPSNTQCTAHRYHCFLTSADVLIINVLIEDRFECFLFLLILVYLCLLPLRVFLHLKRDVRIECVINKTTNKTVYS